MSLRKALFVINPIAGGKKKDDLPDLIRFVINNRMEHKIIVWQSADQNIDEVIKKEIAENGFTMVVAAGGDGTINRIASCINRTSTTLGIIPLGSGNGLARFLKIPMNTQKAIDIIATGKDVFIDTCTLNDKNFYCTSGVGFDAHIGKLFAEAGKRGPLIYVQKIAGEFNKYKPEEYELDIDGKKINRKAFLVTFANSNQYGNEAQIAPQADIQDGLLNITLLKSFRAFQAPLIASRLYLKNFHESKFVETYTGEKIKLTRGSEGPVHFDGDPGIMGKEINVSIFPSTLKICVAGSSKLKG
ncbi:MAG: NAD(+)/NADH kinase [Bacteroidia bacterium]|nr:NAD(+)/NADH kinase [Bacteroidia bacterium]